MISDKDKDILQSLANMAATKTAVINIVNNSRGFIDKAKLVACQKAITGLDKSFVDLFLTLSLTNPESKVISVAADETSAKDLDKFKVKEVATKTDAGAVLVQPKEVVQEKQESIYVDAEIKQIKADEIKEDSSKVYEDGNQPRLKIKSSKGKPSK